MIIHETNWQKELVARVNHLSAKAARLQAEIDAKNAAIAEIDRQRAIRVDELLEEIKKLRGMRTYGIL